MFYHARLLNLIICSEMIMYLSIYFQQTLVGDVGFMGIISKLRVNSLMYVLFNPVKNHRRITELTLWRSCHKICERSFLIDILYQGIEKAQCDSCEDHAYVSSKTTNAEEAKEENLNFPPTFLLTFPDTQNNEKTLN